MVYLPPRPRSDLGFNSKLARRVAAGVRRGPQREFTAARPGPAASSADRYVVLILPFAELAILVFCAQGSRGCAQSASSLGLRKLNAPYVGKRVNFLAKKSKVPVQIGVDFGRCERLGDPLGRLLFKVQNNGICRSHLCSPRRRRGTFEATPNPRRCLQGIHGFGV